MLPVALRKESVDRNAPALRDEAYLRGSLSARRAWIEIAKEGAEVAKQAVALRKESVDRNSHALDFLV